VAGRAFTAQEIRTAQLVVVIGQELADKLLKGVDPLDKKIVIGGLPYRVIGVVGRQGNLFGISLDKFAIMPFSAPGRRLICPINILDALIVQTGNPVQMQVAMGQTEALMRSRRQLKPDQESNFAFQTAEGALGTWQKISQVLFVALPGLVAISLVVGGIVIMNIMLMAVSERTREIGIRKAMGARRRDILAQFVVESATLSAVGAVLGIALGIGLAFVVKATTPLPAAVAPWSIVVGVLLGVTVGIAAGVYPASRASRLDPIAALRAE
jgi:putative ABC transport system permease protein